MQRLSRAAATALALSIPSALVPHAAQAEGLQLEAHVAGWQGLTIGLRAGERVVLSTGLLAAVMEEETDGTRSFSGHTFIIPVEAKLYLTDSVPGAVTPVIALGGHYGRFALQGSFDDQLAGARLMLGADYFVDEHLGFHAATGPAYMRAWGEEHEVTQWLFTWRAGLLLRL